MRLKQGKILLVTAAMFGLVLGSCASTPPPRSDAPAWGSGPLHDEYGGKGWFALGYGGAHLDDNEFNGWATHRPELGLVVLDVFDDDTGQRASGSFSIVFGSDGWVGIKDMVIGTTDQPTGTGPEINGKSFVQSDLFVFAPNPDDDEIFFELGNGYVSGKARVEMVRTDRNGAGETETFVILFFAKNH